MKLLGIGDLFIPKEYIERGFECLKSYGVKIETVNWYVGNFDQLQEINLKIEKNGSEFIEPDECIYEAAKTADIIITQFCPITKNLIDHCKQLKVIGVLRSGIENVNLQYATSKGIIVINTPGRNADAVADFTIGMLISECRNIARGHAGLKKGQWIRDYPNSNYIPDLPGKTVGIIGLGEIGKKVARRLSGFDVNILGYDPYVGQVDGVEMVSLDELAARSDFITIHVRSNKETIGMINKQFISKMKPTSYLINTSRADIIVEEDLYDALKNHKIAGAALDVFSIEPPGIDHPIITLENVTVTPHMAGGSTDAFINSPQKLASEIKKLWESKEPKNIVNRNLLKKIYTF